MPVLRLAALCVSAALLASCGGGGGGGGGDGGANPPPNSPPPTNPPPNSPPPAAYPDIPATDADAARFLAQATFGPTRADIATLRQIGYKRWIDEQLDPAKTPVTLIKPHVMSIPIDNLEYHERRNYWMWKAVTAKDQLRMRMGFALSEIFVVSDRDYNKENHGRISDYQDTLSQGAFGSYRQLLEKVTLHPSMALYLSHMANQKAVSYKNSQGLTVTIVPDENFAREVMQLFSIGLYQRNSDFSLKLDGQGQPIPTYDQNVIAAMAQVMTGWTWAGNTESNFWKWGADNEARPMTCVPKYHEDKPKTIFNGIVIDEGKNCVASLAKTLDALASHANTAPFISRQLIQRFVTSNPSPAYIARIAKVWTDTGGNLGQVVKAILLDSEARVAPAANNVQYGKAREPVLQMTALWRAFDAKYMPKPDGQYRFSYGNAWDYAVSLGQDTLRSPSVFNFFEPDYRLQGTGGTAGIYAPEFQLYNEASFISIFNELYNTGWNNFKTDAPTANTNAPVLDVKPLKALADAGNHAGMVDSINVLLFNGALSGESKTIMVGMLDKLKAEKRNSEELSRSLVQLAVASPEFVVQR